MTTILQAYDHYLFQITFNLNSFKSKCKALPSENLWSTIYNVRIMLALN